MSIALGIPVAAQPAGKKIWDGVFTDGQALRGKSAFEVNCSRCHNIALIGSERGPAIKGPAFLSHGEKDPVAEILMKDRDPLPEGGPGPGRDEVKVRLLFYI